MHLLKMQMKMKSQMQNNYHERYLKKINDICADEDADICRTTIMSDIKKNKLHDKNIIIKIISCCCMRAYASIRFQVHVLSLLLVADRKDLKKIGVVST